MERILLGSIFLAASRRSGGDPSAASEHQAKDYEQAE